MSKTDTSSPAQNSSTLPVASLTDFLQQGLQLQKQGNLTAAADYYQQILHADPNHVDALHLLSLIALVRQDYLLAIQFIERALAKAPQFAALYSNKGSALKALGKYDEALSTFDKALQLDTSQPDAHFNKANLLMLLHENALALKHYQRTVQLRPQHLGSWLGLASAQRALKEFSSAVHSYQQVLTLEPAHFDAYYLMADALIQLGRYEAAFICYERAIGIKPDSAEAYLNRGLLYSRVNRFEEALDNYCSALRINPEMALAYTNMGIVQRKLNDAGAAIASHDKAISLRPDYAEAYINKGVACLDLHDFEAAISCYEQAIRFLPSSPDAHWNLSIALLVSGQWQRGWPLYEWRWKKSGVSLNPLINGHPQWNGAKDIKDKTIFLHCEQGLGDTIHFYRYVTAVADLAGKVLLEVQPALVDLLSLLDARVSVFAKGAEVPAFDLHCPLLSLPLAFSTTLDSVPCRTRYLSVDEHKVQQWLNSFGIKTKPRVGLVWSGSSTHSNDYNRSIPLSALLPLLPEQFDYFCLQKELRLEDAEILAKQSRIQFLGDLLHDFTDTAALCESMDLVISVDTSVAHVSGALGKSTWLLLPFNPDWRWLLTGTDCIWYDAVTLYRQPKPGDWVTILNKISRDLADYAASWADKSST